MSFYKSKTISFPKSHLRKNIEFCIEMLPVQGVYVRNEREEQKLKRSGEIDGNYFHDPLEL